MAVCPNCGASNNDGAKFCSSCGGPLPAPVQQPVYQQPAPQPVYQQPAPQPVYQQPVSQPVVIQPAAQPVQPVYAQPITQPVVKKEKKNGLCVAGFILSLVGLACIGLTCPLGFLFCVIGLIVAIVKKQKGKGLAIAGLIISAFIMICMTALFLSPEWDDFASEFEDLGIYTTTRSDDDDDDDDDNSIDYVKMIEKNNWITTGDNSYMVFDKKSKSFTYYQSYLDTSDNYYSGTYQIFAGDDAFEYITEDISELGVEKSEIRQMINMNEEYEMENLLCICLDYEELIVGGEKQDRDPWTIHYFGFYLTPEEDGKTYNVLDVCNMEAASYVTFVLEKDFKDLYGSSTNPGYGTDPVTTTTVSTTTVVEPTYDDDVEVMGNDITGYVYLTQGTWDYWTEADGMGDYYLSRDMRINRDTSTIINLTVFPEPFNEGNGVDLNTVVNSSVESLRSDGDTNAYAQKITLGGFDAYEITAQYQDGMYLSVFYFYDNYSRLHYVSVEYFDSDIASYEMVKNNFTM